MGNEEGWDKGRVGIGIQGGKRTCLSSGLRIINYYAELGALTCATKKVLIDT